MDCYILHTFLLVFIILFIFPIFCYHCIEQAKTKTYWRTNNIKIQSNKLKEVSIKNHTCFYLDDIFKIDDFDFVKKSYENILIYDVSYKPLIRAKPLYIMFNKVDSFIRYDDGTKYLVNI